MTNDMAGGFVMGIAFSAIVLAIFQMGITIGYTNAVKLVKLNDLSTAEGMLKKTHDVIKWMPHLQKVK